MVDPMVALDLPVKWQRSPYELLRILRDAGCTNYKIHLPFPGTQLRETIWAARRAVLPGKRAWIMLDNKEHDTASTVIEAIKHQQHLGVDWSTVHASGGRTLFQRLKEKELVSSVVAVTVLTSMSFVDVKEIYRADRFDVVKHLARMVAEYGVDKFVCAVADIPYLKEAVRDYCDPMIFTPGMRPIWYTTQTEQFMTATPREAYVAGSHRPIIGRPVTSHETLDPGTAFSYVEREINAPLLFPECHTTAHT
jgi:orotidine-5'-phosphate decarboxylase